MKYRKREVVEAVKFEMANIAEVLAFLSGGSMAYNSDENKYVINRLSVCEGDYIVKRPSGRHVVVAGKEFEENYEDA